MGERAQDRLAGWLAEEAAYRRHLLFLPVVLGAGSLWWFTRDADPDFDMLALIGGGGLLVAVAARGRRITLSALGALVALFVVGALLAALESGRASTVLLDSAVSTTLHGQIAVREQVAGGGWRYRIDVTATEAPEIDRPPLRVTVVQRGDDAPISPGQRVSGRVRLSPPAGPALPGLDDFAFPAFHGGQGATGYFLGTPTLEPATTTPDANWTDRLLGWRSRVGDHIRAVIGGDSGAFAAALVTDERRAISTETTEVLRQAGLAHIIAISGLNMALASGIFFVGLRSLMALSPALAHRLAVRRLAALGALLGVTAYYAISGFAVSAERAYLMSVLVLAAIVIGRPALNLFNLSIAAMVVLAWQPSALMGASFQMSFAATLALIAGYEAMTRRVPEAEQPRQRLVVWTVLRSIGLFLAGVLATSLIGSLATAPYAIAHFHRMAVYGLLANLAAMPLISFVVMPAGLIAMLLMPFGGDEVFLKLMGLGLEGVIAIARAVAGLGGDLLIPLGRGEGLPLLTAGLLLACLLRSPLRYLGTVPFALGLLILLWPVARPDVVIAEDGVLVALVDATRLSTNRATSSGFIIDQWTAALGVGEVVRPDVGDQVPIGGNGHFTCQRKRWCLARLSDGRRIATVEDLDALPEACDAAGLVVAARLPRRQTCRDAILVDPSLLRRSGALALFVAPDGGWQVVPAFTRLDRPWQRHRAYDWRRRDFDERPEEALAARFNGNGG